MATRTKKDLVRIVAENTGLDIQTVKDNVEAMFQVMSEGLGRDGNIEIRNFGVFKVKHVAARTARNPRTGESIKVPEKNLIHFKPGQLMRQHINQAQLVAADKPRVAVPTPPAIEQPTKPEPPKPVPVPSSRNKRTIIRPSDQKAKQPRIILMNPRGKK